MQFKTFILPLRQSSSAEDELNRFLRGHRVLQVERQFCQDGGGYWTLLVEYVDGEPSDKAAPASRRDASEIKASLSDEEKVRYERMREIRSLLSREHNLPAYHFFSNEELAALARLPELSMEAAKGLKGVSPTRVTDYLNYYITALANVKESGKPNAPDSTAGKPA